MKAEQADGSRAFEAERYLGRSSARRARIIARRVSLYAVLVAGGLVMMIPFFWMFLTSLKTRAEVFAATPLSLPSGPHWENYATMWNAFGEVTFGDFFLNSVKLATLNTIGQIIACSLAAYAFAVIPFRGRGAARLVSARGAFSRQPYGKIFFI